MRQPEQRHALRLARYVERRTAEACALICEERFAFGSEIAKEIRRRFRLHQGKDSPRLALLGRPR